MHKDIVGLLRCPASGQSLSLCDAEVRNGEVYAGFLVSEDGSHRYPIVGAIPRFVPESNYADNFGMQWNLFQKTQLDSYSGRPISANRFWRATGWRPDSLSGKWVLDVGCGAGRFAEIALQAGANVVALDYSSAVNACYENLRGHPNLHVMQANMYEPPFLPHSFPFVYSLGVLQHTPDVHRAFGSVAKLVASHGDLCVDYYQRRWQSLLHAKYAFRPLTKRIPKEKLFSLLQILVPTMLKISQAIGLVPVIGRFLKRAIPIADYTGIYDLNARQLEEWALLDTFDMLGPEYDQPQTAATARKWLVDAGFVGVEVFREGHLVARGRNP